MKHLIKIEPTAHGVLGMRHAGRDQQYCEAGELVIIEWQPDAGWGLQEAHYTDKDGNVTAIGGGSFTMPNKEITIGGTFKKFVVQDWTGVGQKGEAMMVGDNGEPIPNNNVTMSAEGNVMTEGYVSANGDVMAKGNVSADGDVTAKGNVSAEGNVSADGDLTVNGNIVLFDVEDKHWYKVFIKNGTIMVEPL